MTDPSTIQWLSRFDGIPYAPLACYGFSAVLGSLQTTAVHPAYRQSSDRKHHHPMQAPPTTMQAAFQDGKQYLVPSYQRNYVWTQEGQWEPLWDDVKAVMTRIIAKGQSATQPHFLGAIITKHIDTIRHVNRWWVVDGQQRLTTLQVLIAAAKSVFANSGLPVAASQLDRCSPTHRIW